MIKVYQRSKKGCLPACIASILEKEINKEADIVMNNAKIPFNYILELNKIYGKVGVQITEVKETRPNMYYISILISRDFSKSHAVVSYNNYIVHNPSTIKMNYNNYFTEKRLEVYETSISR